MSIAVGKPLPLSRQSGVGLIETMVALVIGLFLIASAVAIHDRSRAAYRTVETVARLQETARYAFDVIEADVRMASYWGLSSRPTTSSTVPLLARTSRRICSAARR